MIDIVVGLGWGDEGKGATVDALVTTRSIGNTLRFNDGHQAALCFSNFFLVGERLRNPRG